MAIEYSQREPGVKASGIGRDGGDYSFEFYMETKHVGFATGRHAISRLGA